MRADFGLAQTYVYRPQPRLGCAILCLRGDADRRSVSTKPVSGRSRRTPLPARWSRHPARQLCASDHPAGAVSSGSERPSSSVVARNVPHHAALGPFPKLRVAGSNPVVRSQRSPVWAFVLSRTFAATPRGWGRGGDRHREDAVLVGTRKVGKHGARPVMLSSRYSLGRGTEVVLNVVVAWPEGARPRRDGRQAAAVGARGRSFRSGRVRPRRAMLAAMLHRNRVD